MIALVCVLGALVLLLFGLLCWAGVRIEDMHHRLEERNLRLQTARINQMWEQVKADALRHAADAWDTVEEQGKRKALSWTPKAQQSSSLVDVWLRDRADQIAPPDPTPEHDHARCCRYLLCAHPACCGYRGESR